MSVESFIQAMPKAEVHIHLEGGAIADTLLMIADTNEVQESTKHFATWVGLLKKPDYDRLEELIKVVSGWMKVPEDLTRTAYDLGTRLARQNVRYTEVHVSPSLYPDLANLTMEQFFAAINDGRDRAHKAWGIEMNWILNVPREEPRKADDYARYVTTAAARKAHVVALGVTGKENIQPIGQFERAFSTVEKKGLARVPHAGDVYGAEGVQRALDSLAPTRIAEGWGIAESPDVMKTLADRQIPVDVSLTRALRLNKIKNYGDYPLRKLYDEGIILTIGSDQPTFLKTTLNNEYLAVVRDCGFDVAELEELALNALRVSYKDPDEKDALMNTFRAEFDALRAEHIAPQTT